MRDIEEMKAMASAIRPASALLAKSSNSNVKAYLSVRGRFDYSALIVALYAAFETFVEDILVSYVAIITKKDNYGSLPGKLVTKHMIKTGELLSKGEIDPIRYPGVTSSQLIENLYRCVSGSLPYELNKIAVATHDRNMRYSELGKFLDLVDLSNDDLRKAQSLIEWYYEDQGMTGSLPESVPVLAVQQRLDDFVERRNDVAHRGGNPSNRLGVDEMQSLVEFISAIAHSIFTLFVAHYLRNRQIGSTGCERLILAKGPFHDKHTWVIKPPQSRLYVKQPVFALSPTFLVRWGRVETLQIDDVNRTEVEGGASSNVGVRLEFPAPETAEVYVLGTEDPSIWPALSSP
jgi:hypothetical protein